MHRFMLVILAGIACCFIAPVCASEDALPESEITCDTESDESCATEEDEELDRGFDPCLINASLPACKSADNDSDSGVAREPEPEASENEDSGRHNNQ